MRARLLLAAVILALPVRAVADVVVEDYDVFHKRGLQYMREEKWNLAVDELGKAVAAKNDDDRVWTDLGDALAVDPRGVRFGSAEQNARAAAAYRRATQLNPGSSRAWNNLAWLLAKTKSSLDEALVASKRAVELDEERAGYLDTLAEVLFARGEVKDAVDVEDKARGMSNDDYFQKQYERFLSTDGAIPTPTATEKKPGQKKITPKPTAKASPSPTPKKKKHP